MDSNVVRTWWDLDSFLACDARIFDAATRHLNLCVLIDINSDAWIVGRHRWSVGLLSHAGVCSRLDCPALDWQTRRRQDELLRRANHIQSGAIDENQTVRHLITMDHRFVIEISDIIADMPLGPHAVLEKSLNGSVVKWVRLTAVNRKLRSNAVCLRHFGHLLICHGPQPQGRIADFRIRNYGCSPDSIWVSDWIYVRARFGALVPATQLGDELTPPQGEALLQEGQPGNGFGHVFQLPE